MKITTLIITLSLFSTLSAQWNFPTSLHKLRTGFGYAYDKENDGMENITEIPFAELSCKECHSVTGLHANGNPIDPNDYSPTCIDCHNFENSFTVNEVACLNCHQRQNSEREQYPAMDVHTNEGLTCLSCHSKEEIHGDDNLPYNSLKEPGSVKAKCINCHAQLSNNASHNRHLATVDCAACHAVSVYSCAGCHFETYVGTGHKRFINEFKDYRLLIKKDGMVKLGALVTHSYNGKTNYIISSTHSHIIKKDATTCSDCHRGMGHINVAITEYNNTGFISLAKWDSIDKKIKILDGVIPIPVDWQHSLKIDHATYIGDSSVFPSDPNLWEYLKSETDNSHLYFAEPLDSSTMEKLGFTRFPTNIEPEETIPTEFKLYQNYPNPFNPATMIKYMIPSLSLNSIEGSLVQLKVYDVLGNKVATLVDEYKPAGMYYLQFTIYNEFSSGVYFYQLKVGEYTSTKKMLVLK